MISKSFANTINAAAFGGVGLNIDTWYFGFSTEPISDDGVIPDDAEPKATGYSRYPLPNDSKNFNTPAYIPQSPISSVTNAKDIAFSIIAGAETPVTYWFLSKEQSGNTAELWGKFKNPISLSAGIKVAIPAGNLNLTINNG